MATERAVRFSEMKESMGLSPLQPNLEKMEFQTNVQPDLAGGVTSQQSNIAGTLLGSRYNADRAIIVGGSLRDTDVRMNFVGQEGDLSTAGRHIGKTIGEAADQLFGAFESKAAPEPQLAAAPSMPSRPVFGL